MQREQGTRAHLVENEMAKSCQYVAFPCLEESPFSCHFGVPRKAAEFGHWKYDL